MGGAAMRWQHEQAGSDSQLGLRLSSVLAVEALMRRHLQQSQSENGAHLATADRIAERSE